MKVFVLNKHSKPLMPTTPRKARLLLRDGKAKIARHDPFTIQLLHGSSGYKQPIKLGVDAGYQKVGFSATTDREELFGGDLALLRGMSERLTERAMYRRQRRNRKRHRPPRYDNRRRPKGSLAPSIQHKLDSHLKLVELIKSILPITRVVIEVANFDIQQTKTPGISGTEYQQGEQFGFDNLREYILHRDGHECQNPECKNRSAQKILQVHHVGYWKGDRSDRPGNLITLCTRCHTSPNHQESGFLYGWQPKVKTFRAATFMSTVRWRLVDALDCEHTYGYITKQRRRALGLSKSHHNDAFVIAGGATQVRATPTNLEQNRRNRRGLERFYDAKYLDKRTGEKVSGQTLNSGRRKRNKNLSGENLRVYRGPKVSKGRRSIRRRRYPYQPQDLVLYQGRKYKVQGVQSYGRYVKLARLPKPVKTSLVTPLRWRKGICTQI